MKCYILMSDTFLIIYHCVLPFIVPANSALTVTEIKYYCSASCTLLFYFWTKTECSFVPVWETSFCIIEMFSIIWYCWDETSVLHLCIILTCKGACWESLCRRPRQSGKDGCWPQTRAPAWEPAVWQHRNSRDISIESWSCDSCTHV